MDAANVERMDAPVQVLRTGDPDVHAPQLHAEPINTETERSIGIDRMRNASRRESLEGSASRHAAVNSPRSESRRCARDGDRWPVRG